MRVTVTFKQDELNVAAIHLVPSWLDRILFGSRELDDDAVAVPDIAGGRSWVWGSTGRRITSRRVIDALEDERAELELAQRLGEQERRRAAAGPSGSRRT